MCALSRKLIDVRGEVCHAVFIITICLSLGCKRNSRRAEKSSRGDGKQANRENHVEGNVTLTLVASSFIPFRSYSHVSYFSFSLLGYLFSFPLLYQSTIHVYFITQSASTTAVPTQPTPQGNKYRLRHHKVVARNEVDGFYYPGLVRKCVNPRYVEIDFDGFERQVVGVRYVIPIEGARPCPSLKVRGSKHRLACACSYFKKQ